MKTLIQIEKCRDFSVNDLKKIIGHWNVLAVSGGRVKANAEYTDMATFPVDRNCDVVVTLNGKDLFNVYRVKKAAGKVKDIFVVEDIYFDYLGEVFYKAGMYVNVSFGGDIK